MSNRARIARSIADAALYAGLLALLHLSLGWGDYTAWEGVLIAGAAFGWGGYFGGRDEARRRRR